MANGIGFNFEPSAEESAHAGDAAYFAAYRRDLQAYKDRLAGVPEDGAEEVEEIIVVRPGATVDPASITRASPKKLIKAALAAGFEVFAAESETLKPGLPFKSGSRLGEKRPDKAETHLIVNGRLRGLAAFSATYLGGSFKGAFVWDTAGWPTELYFDYAPTAEKKKDIGEAAALRQSAILDATYNDGEFFVNTGKRLVTTATDFEEWLADVMPGFTPRKKKESVDPDVVLTAPLQSGEWHA